MTQEETPQPYFQLSKNEYGKMWLLYNPEGNGRYKCWEPINGEFWNEFEKLLNGAKSERNKVVTEALAEIDNLREFASRWDYDEDEEIQIRLDAGKAALDKIYKSISSLKVDL